MALSSEFLSCDAGSDMASIRSEKSISFSTIVFHEHPMILGDGRAASGGPTLVIDWEAQAKSTIRLDEYESMRNPRRTKRQLLIPGSVRTALMLESGYTMRDIQETASRRPEKNSSVKRTIKRTLSNLVKSR